MYNHKEIEKKWQNYWDENKTFKVENPTSPLLGGDGEGKKPKYYTLDMFPFPSGAGLHVGHPEGMTANDIIARYKTAKGFNVLHPMGWDAFGLPAENYAIKTGTHPKITTKENIDNFRKQIKSLGFSYDWDREINTTDPEYYKWTQWIFLKMFEKGLAYEQDLPINYCPSCKTGLANEEVLNDFTCERCGTKVEKKKIRQWVLAITKYADRLLTDIDKLDWPEGLKDMQKNWIGKSEGCEFSMKLAQKKGELPLHNVGGHNVLAKFSSIKSIVEKAKKVKSKIKFLGKFDIRGVIETKDLNISFNSNNLLKHFKDKKYKEFILRRNLLPTVFSNIDNIDFNEKGIGYFIFKTLIIKVVLGKQSNGKYFVKTFYKYDKFTDLYHTYLEENNQKDLSISVYTTRIDTVFGMTYAVLAPDHKDVEDFITPDYRDICDTYIQKSAGKSDQDRTQDDKEKTGVFTGSYVINPFNGKEVPLWIGDYVLGNYGTGAVMAVPAHDERDFEFAKKYNLEIIQSIAKSFSYTGKDAPKKGVETLYRKTIDIILENEKGEILLQIEEHKNGKHIHLVGGGIEEGDSELETVTKELVEETGYTDSEVVGPVNLSFAYSFGYRANKDKNQQCIGRVFHVKLKGENQIKSEIDEGKHTIKWVKKEEVGELINWVGHLDFWNHFYSGEKAFTDLGVLVNSGDFDLLSSKEAQIKLTEFAEKNRFGKKKINYKLRDWLFSRQRYWGDPIPLVHCEKCGIVAEKEENLPVLLPETDNFEPSGDGTSPLSKIESFVNCECPKCGGKAKRETNTMPQWGGSCWYYLRYMDPHNSEKLVDPEVEKYWGQVDSYVGGAEHAVLHLLYARFWHKFLFDIGVVSTDEPFYRLRNQGLITAHSYQNSQGKLIANDLVEEKNGQYFDTETGEELKQVVAKMSKSLKNVINPDDVVEEYGADSLRLYEMYMAEFKDSAPWDTKNIVGVKRFLDKVWRAFNSVEGKIAEDDDEAIKILNKTIRKVEEDIENYKFNTAIAQMMILVNYGRPKDETKFQEWKEKFVVILSAFAPFIGEELYSLMGNKKSIFSAKWPEVDESLLVENTIKIAVQVLGKVRGTIEIGVDEDKDSVLEKARNNSDVAKWLEGKNLVKEIYVPGKIVNLVIK